MCGAKVWDARQEEISMRRDWDMLSANVYVARMKVKNLLAGMNCPISYSVAGMREGLQNGRRVRSLFFFCSRLAPTPSRRYQNYAFAFPWKTCSGL